MWYAGKADVNVNGEHKHLRPQSSVVKFRKLAKLKLKNKQYSHFQVLHVILESDVDRTFAVSVFYLKQCERINAKYWNVVASSLQ
jgi:hypothetical protein